MTAIRGNVDRGAWAESLPETEALFYVIHNVAALGLDPAAAGFRAVISGHSHQPGWREKDGVLYVNPGSAGPRRFKLPISVGRLSVTGKRVDVELIDLCNSTSNSADRRGPGHSRSPRPELPRRRARARNSL